MKARLLDEKNQAWQATLRGNYEKALELFDQVLEVEKTLGELHNRGIARLLVDDIEGALSDFQEARGLSPRNRQVHFVGVAFWLGGNFQAAGEDWVHEINRLHSREIAYTDAAGGVLPPALLWWASMQSLNEQWEHTATSKLRQLGRTRRCQSNWPGPIALFLLNKLSEAELIDELQKSTLSQKYPVVFARRMRQLSFYIGAKKSFEENRQEYTQQLKKVVAEGSSILDAEYHLARYILRFSKS